MRAVVNTEYGGPEVLRIVEVERPVPADDEVLVEVHATTVNRTDCGFRRRGRGSSDCSPGSGDRSGRSSGASSPASWRRSGRR